MCIHVATLAKLTPSYFYFKYIYLSPSGKDPARLSAACLRRDQLQISLLINTRVNQT